MIDTVLFEPIKLRLKKHKVFFRKPLPLKKFEKAILGVIASREGKLEYHELGRVLGFATENNPDLNLRIDKAELDIYQSYLEALRRYHLIEYSAEMVQIKDWGIRALEEDRKFGFFAGSLLIPEFFDINCAPSFIIPGWEIGLPATITEQVNAKEIWANDLGKVNESIEAEYFNENYKGDEEIFIDEIESTDDYKSRFVEFKFVLNGVRLQVFYDNERVEFMESLLNSQDNTEKSKELRRKIELKHYLDTSEKLSVDYLSTYLDLLEWREILQSDKFQWNENSIQQLAEWGISWLDISEYCPIQDLFECIQRFQDDLDWTIISDRCDNEFILATLDHYNWNLDILLSRLSIEEFQNHFEKLIVLEGIDLDKFYLELDDDFLIKNIEKLPGVTNLIITQRHHLLSKLIPDYLELGWDWDRCSAVVPIQFLLENIHVLISKVDVNIILNRLFNEVESVSDDILKILLDKLTNDPGYLLNRQTKLKLSLTQLELLEQLKSIYWGNERVGGFEVNPNQDWTFDIVVRFEDNWDYPAAEEFISNSIRDITDLSAISVNWNMEAMSSNIHLCSKSDFLLGYGSVLNWSKTIKVLDTSGLISNFDLIQLSEELTLEKLSDELSGRLSFSHLIKLSESSPEYFYPHIACLKWHRILEKSSDEELKNFVYNNQRTFKLFAENEEFKKSISTRIPLEVILEMDELDWNWIVVTRQALKEGKMDKQLKDDYAHLWDWKTLLEMDYLPEQLQLENELTEIATLISLTINDENSRRAWKYITSVYPVNLIWNAINVTTNFEIFKWDWDYLSSSGKMPMGIHSMEMYAENINWEIFSGNTFLNQLFRYDREMFSSRSTWTIHVLKYLERFKDKWHFDQLSRITSINGQVKIVEEYIEKWDWKLLSSDQSTLLTKGIRNKKSFDLERLIKFKNKIDFDIVSSRTDCTIDLKLIQRISGASWNWQLLSVNPSLKLDSDVFFEKFIDKDWDWFELSKNRDLSFTNDNLIELSDKNLDWYFFSQAEWLETSTILQLRNVQWDWGSVSRNSNIIFNIDLLQYISDKDGVQWNSILRSANLHLNSETLELFAELFDVGSENWNIVTQKITFDSSELDLIEKFKSYWNWELLLSEFKLDFNNLDVLNKFEDCIDWLELSMHDKFKPDIPVLLKYRNQLNWYSITPKLDFSSENMSSQLVNELEEFLDWTYICSRANFKGGLEFVKKFYNRMDLYRLISNSSIDVETYKFLNGKIEADVYSNFVYRLKEQKSPWSGFIYHFTHLTNAIEIIRSRKIFSRDRAQIEAGNFSDAAGSVVHRKSSAHQFARFYFRPQTPTQFYNECLGKDISDGRYYDAASKLGLPKCPVPVFFKFDLEEVFSLMSESSYVSNGNMQKDRAKVGTIREMLKKFNFDYLYSTPTSGIEHYKEGSQQEFLVKDIFDFSKLKKYEILVMNENDLAQLYLSFKDDKEILSKTRVARNDDYIFVDSNKRIDYSIKGKVLKVSTKYAGDGKNKGEFTLKLEHSNYRIRSGEPMYATNNSLTFYPQLEVEFEEDMCFKLIFKDLATKKEPWEIIKYCDVN